MIKDGRTYLPIRVVLESFDAEVSWDGSVSITTDAAGALIEQIEGSTQEAENFWAEWQTALNLKENGQWSEAIAQFHRVSYSFLTKSDSASKAMFYKHLGECYANNGEASMAAACFAREADYWEEHGDHQASIDADRRSELIRPFVQVYAKTKDADYKSRTLFEESNEVKNGILLGAYAETDEAVHDGMGDSKFYMDDFPQMVGKDMGAYLLYMRSDVPFSHYESHFRIAREQNKVMQIALEPVDLFAIRKNSSNYIHLAKAMDDSGLKIFLRFAGEMNDPGNPWYSEDPEVFKEKFRYVAEIFHQYAKDVAIVWAPNHYPMDNAMDYYPGDEYVDYVGLSAYADYRPELDPLGQGIDRSRFSMKMDTLYQALGYKKPFIVVESGASYIEYSTGKVVSDFAAQQIKDFYTYLPIRYPNLHAVFTFDGNNGNYCFKLSENSACLAAYKKAIQNPMYLSSIDAKTTGEQYYELGNNVHVLPAKVELASFVKTADDDLAYVVYQINGANAATGYDIPYTVTVDFSPYVGQTVTLDVIAFDQSGVPVAKTACRLAVDRIE